MTSTLEKILSHAEIGDLSQTIRVKGMGSAGEVQDRRPKVRYVARSDTSVLKIMGGVAFALRQRGLVEEANELRRLILGGAYDEPGDALSLIGNYVRLQIVNEQGAHLGTIE
jgi:hypothetical protein